MRFKRLSLLGLLAALITTVNLAIVTTGVLGAAPSDVRGSGNVAVTSYKNSQGTFILYSDGRITNFENGDVVAPPYSDEVPDYVKASALRGQPNGSPNVAVGIVPHKRATYILFADGSVKNPVNANKPNSSHEVIVGVVDFSTGYGNNTQTTPVAYGTGFTYQLPTGAAGQPGINNILFDEPFDEPPVVIVSPIGDNGGNHTNNHGFGSQGIAQAQVAHVNRYGFRLVNPLVTNGSGSAGFQGQNSGLPVIPRVHFAAFEVEEHPHSHSLQP